MAEQHPDHQIEKDRLDYTKSFINEFLEAAEQKQRASKENIHEAFVNLDHLDSSLSYINILVNARFFETSASDLAHLKKVVKKPYFGRIDFQNEESGQEESYYIGKVSLFTKDTHESVIIDWRSPIASLYYDGRLGESSYEAEAGTIDGSLNLKRQYVIEDGVLEEIRDIDVTTRDELLQVSLSGSADHRLNEIVSTIQAEQNEVVRADLSKPIVVQGVAGSGKTTIALHRLSMFIYTYSEQVDPKNIMILAPNDLFIDYISEALPELGVDDIRQTTFTEYVRQAIGRKVKVQDSDEKLLTLLEDGQEDNDFIAWASGYKGSLDFKEEVDAYIRDFEHSFRVVEDLKIEGFTVFKGKKVERLFFEEYAYLPYYERVKKVKSVLKTDFKKKKKEMEKRVEDKFEASFDRLYYSMTNTEERRPKVVKLHEERDRKLDSIKQTTGKVVDEYMKDIAVWKVVDHYKDFMEKLGERDDASLQQMSLTSLKKLKSNNFELEDLAPLLYLKKRMYGMKDENRFQKVVIDEAQDYSPFQLYALKEATGTDLFTILGDLSQGIHSYRGLHDWDTVMEHIFPKAIYRTLKKSYRTTVEIMETANNLLTERMPHLDTAEPVVRHGQNPDFIKVDKTRKETALAETVERAWKRGALSVSIITKTMKDATSLFKKWESENVQLLTKDEKLEHGKVAILPSYLAKGLEFDAVILVNGKETYQNTELDIKLLYVAMTRALHQLYFVGETTQEFLYPEGL
ncbi:RNA polymerase recycling motor HelD [Salimicrobium flavidum]|uniref:DNA helicase-2 / ATP-dependent DNA helicase PcrA n=1 Tax=Salimicrobium flavidum TaxID=570947 RepID=A0A1N7KWF9_9BACI|nr:RNA polymerase recycling motor HelD [Salimicrobium flavidum]SIS65826.1 DNA helicase-2 / ATP-dependent DNA helicase PcrA [Salimicrobium flavidum]